MKKNKIYRYIVSALLAAAVLAAAVWLFLGARRTEEEVPAAESGSGLEEGQVLYNGITYEYRDDLKTYLFLGVDNQEEQLEEERPGQAGQADCILVFVADPEDETITILQVSRDTMTDVELYDLSGEKFATEEEQIALQYAYGDGGTRSCWLMEQAVSRLLYGVDIDAYLAMNLEGFAKATDLVGGVTLKVPEDYTKINPLFSRGARIHMDGALAEQYVRSRDTKASGSNDQRMERQTQFLEALAKKMADRGGDAAFYTKILTELEDQIVTDVTAEDLERLSTYEMAGTKKLPGETRAGEAHDEYRLDEDALYEMILELFYAPVPEDTGRP